MPNIGTVLKSEISRVARKEVKAEMQTLKKHSSQYRSAIATLKKQVAALERQLTRQNKVVAKAIASAPAQEEEDPSGPRARFSAQRFAARRSKLGLSAREMGALLGVSSLSVYKWEQGKVRPRASQVQTISRMGRLGKREIAARLTELGA